MWFQVNKRRATQNFRYPQGKGERGYVDFAKRLMKITADFRFKITRVDHQSLKEPIGTYNLVEKSRISAIKQPYQA